MKRGGHGGAREGAGRPKGRPAKRLVLLLPEELYLAVKKDAEERGTSINLQIREAIIGRVFFSRRPDDANASKRTRR